MSQFAMVEELAFLIKDNLPCKHLVLSMEEVFIDFLHDDASPNGVMELQPMNPYNRLLLHRLADIFGFAHESVGEGDNRHLILERCPEASIPSILVSDILCQYDESQYPTASRQVLTRTEVPVSRTKATTFHCSLEEREAAYLAARERIFSVDESEIKETVKQKPRSVPVVAQRMISHALGQRIKPCNQKVPPRESEKSNFQEKVVVMGDFRVEANQETICHSNQNVKPPCNSKDCDPDKIASRNNERKVPQKPTDNKLTNGVMSQNGRNGSVVCKDNLKEKHLGAAKRLFAHALGLQSAKYSPFLKRSEAKQADREKV